MDYLKCPEKKTHKPRILQPLKPSSRVEGEIKTFSNKEKKMREFVTSRPDVLTKEHFARNVQRSSQREGK